MGWWRERRERIEAERAGSLAKALVEALSATARSQAEMGQMVGGWIKELGDISVKRSAALLGSRGGKRTQERKRAAKASPASCVLCRNPLASNLSVDIIQEHRKHEAQLALDLEVSPEQKSV